MKDKRRKAAIRAEQKASGLRYTAVAREMAIAGTERAFLLQDLLSECATFPPATVDWGYPEELAPVVFESRVLGGAVPFSTVLQLAGALAEEGRGARLKVESMHPLETAVVACGQRRFDLVLSQDSWMRELCRTPGCNDTPAHDVIVHCRQHLAERPVSELVSMASDWGYYHCEGISDPTLLMGSPDADLLVKAAVVHGAFEQVTTALLNACFDDPHTLEERHLWDESAAIAIRYAMDRERVRLQQVATTEARRIRKATGSCTACGQALSPWINLHLPPQFCSKECTPRSPEKGTAWSPWSEHIAPA